jgi:hypothetical protein
LFLKYIFFFCLAQVPALRGTAAAVRLTADKASAPGARGCGFFLKKILRLWVGSVPGLQIFLLLFFFVFSLFGSFTVLIFSPLLCWVQSLIRPGPGGVEMFFFFFSFFFFFYKMARFDS